MIKILVASVVIPNGTDPKPVVQLVWPEGEIERVTLHGHDWSADSWDWRGGHMPDSLGRFLRKDRGLDRVHGSRTVYTSPEDVGNGTNELGRLMVYEVEYEGSDCICDHPHMSTACPSHPTCQGRHGVDDFN